MFLLIIGYDNISWNLLNPSREGITESHNPNSKIKEWNETPNPITDAYMGALCFSEQSYISSEVSKDWSFKARRANIPPKNHFT